jgi:hypothetical protein
LKRLVVALLAVVVAVVVGAVPAAAKTPAGPAALAGVPAVDAHLGYQKQKTCSSKAKPGATALLALLISTWGGSSSGISRACGVGGVSEHKEGRALDWHMDVANSSQRKRVDEALAWLTANNGEAAYRLGIMYIIWNQRIWSIYYQELGWRPMPNRGSYTANHKDHVHISLSWDGAMQQTSWWTGVPVTEPLNSPCGTGGAPACRLVVRRAGDGWRPTGVVIPPFLPAPWVIPGIGGSPQVGRTLRVVPGTWVPAGATLAYQWLAGSKPIAGAVGPEWVVTPSVVGKEIKVRVTATTPDGRTTAKTSDGTTDVLPVVFHAPKPVIAGARTTGTLLSVNLGAWTPGEVKFAYQWYRGGKQIKGATKPTYRLVPKDLGKRITVKVTGKAAGVGSKSLTSAATTKIKKGKLSVTAAPAVCGDLVLGRTLTVARGAWTPDGAKFTYQWYRDGKPIKKATKASYKLVGVDLGAVIRVRVRASKKGYLNTYATSAPGLPVARTLPPPAPVTPPVEPPAAPAPPADPAPPPSPAPPSYPATPSDPATPAADPAPENPAAGP